MKNAVWCISGMEHFGLRVSEILNWPLYVDAPLGDDIDIVYIVGMYDPPHYGFTLENTKKAKRKVIQWAGTDVLMLTNRANVPDAIHLCDSDGLRRELFEKGVDAKVCMHPAKHHYKITPFPEEPQVSMYLGSDPEKYGATMLMALMDALPDVKFATYMLGMNDAEEMQTLCEETTVYLRLTRHDGSAVSAREFMEAGKPCVITADLPFATQVRHDDLIGIIVALKKALKTTLINQEMVEYWTWENSEARFLCDLYNYAGIEPNHE